MADHHCCCERADTIYRELDKATTTASAAAAAVTTRLWSSELAILRVDG